MRVAFIVNRFPVVSEMFIANSAVGLIERGHDVDFFCLRGPGWPDVLNSAGRRHGLNARCHVAVIAEASWLRRLLALPGACASVVRHRGLRFAMTAFNAGAHRRRFAQLLPIHELVMWNDVPLPDVIHCQFGMLGDPMLRHIRSGAMPSALVVHFRGHDVDPYISRLGPGAYDDIFHSADMLISNSAHFRDRLLTHGCPAERIRVVESPTDVNSFPWRPPSPPIDRPVRLLTVGRLVEKKGIAQAIDAMAELRRRGRAFTYRVIGSGSDRALLEAQIASLDLGDCVSLVGSHPHDVVAAELAAADIFLGPSVTDRLGEADAAINTLKEAMLTGLPVIGTWHGGIPELVEDGVSGLLVPERDPVAIADAVERLLDRPDSWGPMSRHARSAVEDRFSLDTIARQTLEVYAEALARRRERTARVGNLSDRDDMPVPAPGRAVAGDDL
jgi:colanic acid/amylovoran biosynthesis glycosyltransferase